VNFAVDQQVGETKRLQLKEETETKEAETLAAMKAAKVEEGRTLTQKDLLNKVKDFDIVETGPEGTLQPKAGSFLFKVHSSSKDENGNMVPAIKDIILAPKSAAGGSSAEQTLQGAKNKPVKAKKKDGSILWTLASTAIENEWEPVFTPKGTKFVTNDATGEVYHLFTDEKGSMRVMPAPSQLYTSETKTGKGETFSITKPQMTAIEKTSKGYTKQMSNINEQVYVGFPTMISAMLPVDGKHNDTGFNTLINMMIRASGDNKISDSDKESFRQRIGLIEEMRAWWSEAKGKPSEETRREMKTMINRFINIQRSTIKVFTDHYRFKMQASNANVDQGLIDDRINSSVLLDTLNKLEQKAAMIPVTDEELAEYNANKTPRGKATKLRNDIERQMAKLKAVLNKK